MNNKENAGIALQYIRRLLAYTPKVNTVLTYFARNGWVRNGVVKNGYFMPWVEFENPKYKTTSIADGTDEIAVMDFFDYEKAEEARDYKNRVMEVVSNLSKFEGAAKELILMQMMMIEDAHDQKE